MRAMEDDAALLVLARAGVPAPLLRQRLAGACPGEVLAGLADGDAPGVSAAALAALRRPDRPRLAADLAWARAPAHHVIGWHDPDYPALLRFGPAPPPILFGAGDPALAWQPQVALVGSRRPSPGGRDRARRWAGELAAAGWAVTSGLAEGIDAAAHAGCLDAGGATIAVIGTGPDRAYPAGHAGLMQRIATDGLVLGEHPPGTGPVASHFPSRNRIIAGLSLGTVVMEAALRSGALITARLAADAGREVMAVPGSPDHPLARGCHRLIRQGAALVEAPEEVVAALAPLAHALAERLRGRLAAVSGPAPAPVRPAADVQPDVPSEPHPLWSALGTDPTGVDVLAERTGLTVAELAPMLLLMELDGHVVNDHGRYSRRS